MPKTTHGFRKNKMRTKEYVAWDKMMSRCYNPKNPSFKYYGGVGIIVCDRWHTFQNFLSDMGAAPTPLHSLDRFPNNSGNYEPSNCRWATSSEQRRNQKNIHMVTHNGKTMCLKDWSIELGIPGNTLRDRAIKGRPLTTEA